MSILIGNRIPKEYFFVTINWNKGAMNHLKEKKVKKKSFVFIDNPWLPLLLRANFNERFRLGLNVKLNNTRAFQENGPQTFITNPTQWKLIKKRHIKEVDFSWHWHLGSNWSTIKWPCGTQKRKAGRQEVSPLIGYIV